MSMYFMYVKQQSVLQYKPLNFPLYGYLLYMWLITYLRFISLLYSSDEYRQLSSEHLPPSWQC